MSEQSSYLTITDENFSSAVLEQSHLQPVLVDFWAPWCGPCQVIAPVIEELATEFAGRATVGKVNVDEHPRLAVQYGIQSIPTLLLFKDGRLVDQVIGAVPKQVLENKLRALVQAA